MQSRCLIFLLLALMAAFSGCAEEKSVVEYQAEGLEPSEKTLVDETVNVKAGQYVHWKISFGVADVSIKGCIGSSHAVDIWLLAPREFQAFKKSESFYPIGVGSREDTYAFSFEYEPSDSGDYYFVVDNKESWITSKAVYVSLSKVGYF